MKVRMTVGLAGGVHLQPGDEHDFEQAEAIRLIEAGYAVPIGEAAIERATRAPAPERRASRKA